MDRTKRAYVETYVAMQRTERHAARHDSAWTMWAERAVLAERLGQPELAAAARRRALHHGDRAAQFHRSSATQGSLADELRTLANSPKRW